MTSVLEDRLAVLPEIEVTTGSHAVPDGAPKQACAMELVSWLAGEVWSDCPECVDVRLAALIRVANDAGGEGLGEWARELAPLVVGITDASELLDRLAVRRLRETVLPLAPSWSDDLRDECVSAIKGVIVAIETGGDREAARSAAWAAEWKAADSAEAAAAESAWSAAAADSAEAAARSARSAAAAEWSTAAAESAAWAAESAARSAEAAEWSTAAAESAWSAAVADSAAAESAWSARSAAAESAWRDERSRILEEARRAVEGRTDGHA